MFFQVHFIVLRFSHFPSAVIHCQFSIQHTHFHYHICLHAHSHVVTSLNTQYVILSDQWPTCFATSYNGNLCVRVGIYESSPQNYLNKKCIKNPSKIHFFHFIPKTMIRSVRKETVILTCFCICSGLLSISVTMLCLTATRSLLCIKSPAPSSICDHTTNNVRSSGRIIGLGRDVRAN